MSVYTTEDMTAFYAWLADPENNKLPDVFHARCEERAPESGAVCYLLVGHDESHNAHIGTEHEEWDIRWPR